MIGFQDCCSVTGQLFYVVRRDGVVIEEFSEQNMIMTDGRIAVARLFAGGAGGNGAFVGVGSSNEPPSPDQTGLTGEVQVPVASVTFANAVVVDGVVSWEDAPEPTPNVRFNFVFGPDDANGLEIREFGLFTADGAMFARRIRRGNGAIAKDSDIEVEGYWVIRF